ncbi:MAG TPA: Ig-like domain repeat protein [Nitrososphaerales archaeon]|nr:Ig-like domain repeat protein [Nitrososphaerales archaeon]
MKSDSGSIKPKREGLPYFEHRAYSMKHDEAPPPISKDKARRLGVGGRSRKWMYLVSFLLVGSVVATGGAYAFLSHPGGSGSSTSSLTSNTGTSSSVTSVTTGSNTTSSSGLLATSAKLVCSPSPQIVDAGSTCTVIISNSLGPGHGAAPSGKVGFTSGSAGGFGAITCLPAAGTLVCDTLYTPALGAEGNHTLTATYAGDSGHHGSSASIALQVNKRPSSVGVSCSPGVVPVNSKTTCTAIISDTGAGTTSLPSGAVNFAVTPPGRFSASGCALSGGSCSVEFYPSPGNEGPISLPAAYGGDSDHAPSNGLGTNALTAVTRPTSASVTCVPSITTSGSQVYCKATVEDSLGSGTPLVPKGDFTFSSSGAGSFSPATCSLVALSPDTAACAVHYTPALGNTASSQQIGGNYGGDPDHSTSSAAPFTLQVRARATSLSLSCASALAIVNTPLSCTAKVSDASGTATQAPTGGVNFVSTGAGSFSPVTCTIHSGACSTTYTPWAGSEGSTTLTGVYSGDPNFGPSSASIVINVDQRQSSTMLSCSPSTVPVNSPTLCTATVSDSTGAGTSITPTGIVSFSSLGGSFSSGSTCKLSAGSCSVKFTPSPGREGAISVGAGYSGDVDHYGGTATPFGVTATTRSVTVSVSCSPPSISSLGTTTCTVTVTDSVDPGAPIGPTGTVHFSDDAGGGFSTADCILSSGSCSVTYTGPLVLLPTTATITATYSGDADHSGGSATTPVNIS